MQYITIEYQNEKGELIEKLSINFADILNTLDEKVNCTWLKTIDPYGDTTFNVLQRPYLILELTELQEKNINEDIKNKIKELIDFLKKINDDIHTYLKFIGD